MANNQFDEFMESIPVDANLVEMLNNLLKDKSMSDFIYSNEFPADLGEFEEVFHDHQFGDDASTRTVVWHSKKYDQFVETYYYYDSYNGDDYSDSEFREVKPETRTYTYYAPTEK